MSLPRSLQPSSPIRVKNWWGRWTLVTIVLGDQELRLHAWFHLCRTDWKDQLLPFLTEVEHNRVVKLFNDRNIDVVVYR